MQSLSADELINLDKLDEENNAPNVLPLNKVVTGVMGVASIRSDDFELRVKEAQLELSNIRVQKDQ